MTSNSRWRKSTYSGGENNQCVELDVHPAQTKIRDSKNRTEGVLELAPAPWSALLAAVKDNTLAH